MYAIAEAQMLEKQMQYRASKKPYGNSGASSSGRRVIVPPQVSNVVS